MHEVIKERRELLSEAAHEKSGFTRNGHGGLRNRAPVAHPDRALANEQAGGSGT
jgi:hypothetical protein